MDGVGTHATVGKGDRFAERQITLRIIRIEFICEVVNLQINVGQRSAFQTLPYQWQRQPLGEKEHLVDRMLQRWE